MTTPTTQAQKTLYEKDFYLWLQTTAELLKNQRLDQIDWENLIEEIESMGRSERKEIKSRLIILLEHLLKLSYWESEKEYNSRGWRNTIIEQRRQIELTLEDSPSLKTVLSESFLDCYQKARMDTIQKTQLSSNLLPSEPPFTLTEVLNPQYFPQSLQM
ncbi:DUF29 domain-containing protein [Aphanothece hegewaldii CCALA 016]|uniref:DUF29 domain-containing protein n=1 Tax=Aphanothece hegewaldii CCALA 016 TaxID=2107694 RepID=A0A2T1LSB4_9CHRO|nr:DUF29 domain-containing protein [Aphanothece hegewaldii]PSF32646.1 DUF29 domain-containing protein [Aphanothece hegewaldii CCALA 016]